MLVTQAFVFLAFLTGTTPCKGLQYCAFKTILLTINNEKIRAIVPGNMGIWK